MSDQVDAADLSGAVAALQAVEEIKQLKYRYVRACDLKDMDALIDCFAVGDILVDYESTGRFERAEKFAAAFAEISLLEEDGEYVISEMHHVIHPCIMLQGPDTASGTWMLRYRAVNTATMTEIVAAGDYQDSYRRIDGSWKIVGSRYRTLWSFDRPLDDECAVSAQRVSTAGDGNGAGEWE